MAADRAADWLPFGEARAAVLASVAPLEPVRLPLERALGHVLAEDIVSSVDLPVWENSAMDGYAVRAEDVRGASTERPRELPVTGDVPAGAFPAAPLPPGSAVRVMTGAPLPEGADSVVRMEHTEGGGRTGTRVRILSDADAGANVRPRGQDVTRGARLLERGRVLRPADLGVAAAVGRAALLAVRRPVVGVLSSGNELVEVDRFQEVVAGRKIVASNGHTLAAQLREIGVGVRLLGIAADDPADLRSHVLRARGCDALVTSAGVSVGEHDHVLSTLRGLGLELAFWRVRMRPGSPFAFGRLRALDGIPWFGLPGNPVSAAVTFELLARPALLRMAGHTAVFPPTLPVRLAEDFPRAPGLFHFPRVQLHPGPESTATLSGGQGSHLLTSLARADALLAVPPDPSARGLLPAILLGGTPLRVEPGFGTAE